MRIMIVEDEPASAEYIAEILKRYMPEAMVCAFAEDGEDALLKMAAAKPDAVITDISMPRMDGLALTAALKARCPHVGVIIVSGYQEFEYARKALRYGVTDYLLKPLSPHELVECLCSMKPDVPFQKAQSAEIPSSSPFNSLSGYVHDHLAEPLTLSKICHECGVSQTTANRIFRRNTGKSFLEYLTAKRIEKACALLSGQPDMLIKTVAVCCGFCDPLYFSKVFKTAVGCSPSEYAERCAHNT